MLRHVAVAPGITQIGSAAWQSRPQLQIVKLPPSVVSLQDGAFQGCYVFRQIEVPGCVQFGIRVFAECCSLSQVSPGKEACNALAPGAQIAPFESPLGSLPDRCLAIARLCARPPSMV